MCKLPHLGGREDETLRRVQSDLATNDEVIAKKSLNLLSQRNWCTLREGLDLNGMCPRGVLSVDDHVNAARVACCWHDVPTEPGKTIANVKQSHVADDLVVE